VHFAPNSAHAFIFTPNAHDAQGSNIQMIPKALSKGCAVLYAILIDYRPSIGTVWQCLKAALADVYVELFGSALWSLVLPLSVLTAS